MKRGNKGQLTIFIIIAILIVAIVLFIFLFWPDLRSTTTESENPYTYIRECIEDSIEETVEVLGTQGGVMENSAYFIYDREKVEYLCYTNLNYQPCVVQQPLLISSFENELLTNVQGQIDDCFDSLESNYRAKGWEVELNRDETEVDLSYKKIIFGFNARLFINKGGDSQEYTNFDLEIPSNIHDILSLASSIIQWERDYGEAPTSLFMDLYDYKIEKFADIDGTHVYIIIDKEHNDKFQFASRSLVRPSGVTL
jgi:hypothetical protein